MYCRTFLPGHTIGQGYSADLACPANVLRAMHCYRELLKIAVAAIRVPSVAQGFYCCLL